MKFSVRFRYFCIIPFIVWMYFAINDLRSPEPQKQNRKLFPQFHVFKFSANGTDVAIGSNGVEVKINVDPADIEGILDRIKFPEGRQATLLETHPLMHNPHYCFARAYHSPYDQGFTESFTLSDNSDLPRHGSFVPQSGWIPLDENIANNATEKIHWVFYVHTAAANIRNRQLIRKTWGYPRLFKDYNMRILFVVGRQGSASRQKKLELEYSIYGDILQGDFLDTYKNITYKAVFTLKWLLTYCSHVPIVMKSDDDAFINIFHMKQHLLRYSNLQPPTDSEKSKSASESTVTSSFAPTNALICGLYDNSSSPILRDKKTCEKWCVGKNDLRGMKYYPSYCAGLVYLFTMPLVRRLYENVKTTPFLWIDDVYVTGLLRMSVKDINYLNIYDEITLSRQKASREYRNLSKPLTHHIVHVRDPDAYSVIWNLLLKRLTSQQLEELTIQPEKLKLKVLVL